MILGDNYIRDIKLGNKRVELAIGNTPALKYKRLDYISSTLTGGQWIDLGCKLFETTDSVRIDAEFKVKGNGKDATNHATLINAMQESSPYPGFVLRRDENTNNVMLVVSNYFPENNYVFTGGAYAYAYLDKVNSLINCDITFGVAEHSLHNGTTTLFCSLDGSGNVWRCIEADLYYLKLYKNGLLVRDLIPVQRTSDNEVGLVDLINNVFYSSQGNESFIAGYNYDSEILYLESTGNQFINLDYKVYNHGLSGEIVMQRLSNNSGEEAYIGRSYQSGFDLYTYANNQICLWVQGNNSALDLRSKYNANLPIDKDIHHVIFDINNNGTVYLKVDNDEYSSNYTTKTENSEYIQLFSHKGHFYATGRIYSCKLWFEGNLIYDLIPVRKNGIGYMYDKLNRKLFGDSSSSSTPFNLGPDI